MADFRIKGSRGPYFPPARRLTGSSQYSFIEHDDRNDDRVVKFKGAYGRRRPHCPRNRADAKIRLGLDEEGDVSMGNDAESGSKSHRVAPYAVRDGRRGGKNRRGRSNYSNIGGKNNSRENSWFRMVIPHGDKFEKDFVLKSITDFCEVPFVPYQYHNDGKYAVFYVETYDAARAIERVSMRIQTSSGFKMKILAYCHNQPPPLALNEGVLEKIKLCMSRRFTAETGRLDLSRFHMDPELKSQGLFVILQRTNLLMNVMKIIEDNIPELQILDLSSNKISGLDALKSLSSRVKGIKILVLRDNSLRRMEELDHIKDLPLEELVLDANPLCDHFSDQAAYVSAVRQRFPKIVRLDGQELPPTYGFGLDTETTLPPSQGSFFPNEATRELIPEFLKQYYGIYDSEDRQPLLDAYHDQAFFSMSVSPGSKSGSGWKSLANYQSENRNLMAVNSTGRRTKLLRQGKLGVVSFITSLPKTTHDPASFSIDVGHVSPGLLEFSCCGVFREVDSRTPNVPIRSFSRSFVLVPQGSGYCIVNEMLFITNATSDQAKVAFKVPAPTPSPSPVPPPVAPIMLPGPEQQQQMVLAFSQQSGMNAVWALKCLQENDWDFERAAAVFQQFHKEGKIPPQAFEAILTS